MMVKEVQETRDQRVNDRKKRALEYAERFGKIDKACRYFRVARSSFYDGETGIGSSLTRV